MGMLYGCLAAACIFGGLILLLTKRRNMFAIPLGILDMAFVVLSVKGFRNDGCKRENSFARLVWTWIRKTYCNHLYFDVCIRRRNRDGWCCPPNNTE